MILSIQDGDDVINVSRKDVSDVVHRGAEANRIKSIQRLRTFLVVLRSRVDSYAFLVTTEVWHPSFVNADIAYKRCGQSERPADLFFL